MSQSILRFYFMDDIINYVREFLRDSQSKQSETESKTEETGILKLITHYWWGTGQIELHIAGFPCAYDTHLAYHLLQTHLGITFIKPPTRPLTSGPYFQLIDGTSVVDNATVRKILRHKWFGVNLNGIVNLQFSDAPIQQEIVVQVTGFPRKMIPAIAMRVLSERIGLPVVNRTDIGITYGPCYPWFYTICNTWTSYCVNNWKTTNILRRKNVKCSYSKITDGIHTRHEYTLQFEQFTDWNFTIQHNSAPSTNVLCTYS